METNKVAGKKKRDYKISVSKEKPPKTVAYNFGGNFLPNSYIGAEKITDVADIEINEDERPTVVYLTGDKLFFDAEIEKFIRKLEILKIPYVIETSYYYGKANRQDKVLSKYKPLYYVFRPALRSYLHLFLLPKGKKVDVFHKWLVDILDETDVVNFINFAMFENLKTDTIILKPVFKEKSDIAMSKNAVRFGLTRLKDLGYRNVTIDDVSS